MTPDLIFYYCRFSRLTTKLKYYKTRFYRYLVFLDNHSNEKLWLGNGGLVSLNG